MCYVSLRNERIVVDGLFISSTESVSVCDALSSAESVSVCVTRASHTHLRILPMVRKARPQLSVHSVTIRITSVEYLTVRILSAT